MTETRRYFGGDTGAKALYSFLHNVIDPKGKNLRDNLDNVKKIFDLMAENIPQLHDEEEDKKNCQGHEFRNRTIDGEFTTML